MREALTYILNNYLDAKQSELKDNATAIYIRHTASKRIESDARIDTRQYKVESSAGQGNWADIPWIAIFDKDITKTATKGYDIVYLFRSDMSGVYLSLNQGWTYFKDRYGIKDGKKNIETVAMAWKNTLSSTLNDFSYDPIDLKSKRSGTDLTKGYELGHICGKYYDAHSIPNDAELIRDLTNMLGVYRELKGHMKGSSIEAIADYLIVNSTLGLMDANNGKEKSGGVETVIQNYEKSTLTEEGRPRDLKISSGPAKDATPRKPDYLKKAKNQMLLGLAGELMVLNYEKTHLIMNGKENLANKVKHVSVEDGDGAGYDILSYDLEGNKKYIEVKTTEGDQETSFYISANEV